MFFVSDKPTLREKRIRSFVAKEPAIAILLAAAHFEWTTSRAVMFLSTTPTAALRTRLRWCTGLDRYRDLWRDEISATGKRHRLPTIVTDWARFRDAFDLRHQLIHGRGTCTSNFASPRVERILAAANDVHSFCAGEGVDLNTRMPFRRARKT